MGDNIAIFMLGMVCGTILCTLAAWLGLQQAKKTLAKTKKELDDKTTVKDRLLKVKEITKEQLSIQARLSYPQKNGLDGKYKNQLINQIKQLEEDKTAILVSIVTDGHDPEITVMDEDGQTLTLKLSAYLDRQGISTKPAPPEPRTKHVGKFTVHKGGKDDGSGGNTTH